MENITHEAFHRPNTFFNNALDWTFSHTRVHHEVNLDVMNRWRDSSLEVFRGFGDEKYLERAVEKPSWRISSEIPPRNVWFGEAKFLEGREPEIILYTDSVTSRLPTDFAFEVAGQSGMDHIFGHLLPFYAGEKDYGEEVACRYQFLAARARGGIKWNLAAGMIAGLHKVHKDIPIRNYK